MFDYTRNDVLRIASENAFLVNNTEKVLRLCRILNYIKDSSIYDYLALKGGTAINLCLLDLPRLSIDIDFDFTKNLPRDEMLIKRDEIHNQLVNYMLDEGYLINDRSKSVPALDSMVFTYRTTAGSNDILKIEINYLDRLHVLDVVDDIVHVKLGDTVKIKRLSNEELIASKMSALVSRTTPRDIYDVNNIIINQIGNFELIRKIAIFYIVLGDDNPIDFEKTIDKCLDKISLFDYKQARDTLIPLLKRKEKLSIEKIKQNVSMVIRSLFSLTDNEKEFIKKYNNGVFEQKLLFEEDYIDLSNHPLLLWKQLNMKK